MGKKSYSNESQLPVGARPINEMPDSAKRIVIDNLHALAEIPHRLKYKLLREFVIGRLKGNQDILVAFGYGEDLKQLLEQQAKTAPPPAIQFSVPVMAKNKTRFNLRSGGSITNA